MNKWLNVPFSLTVSINRIDIENLSLLIGSNNYNDKILAKIFRSPKATECYWTYQDILINLLLSEKINLLLSENRCEEIDIELKGSSTGCFYPASINGWQPEEGFDERILELVHLDGYSKETDKYIHYEIEESSFIKLFEDEFTDEIYETDLNMEGCCEGYD